MDVVTGVCLVCTWSAGVGVLDWLSADCDGVFFFLFLLFLPFIWLSPLRGTLPPLVGVGCCFSIGSSSPSSDLSLIVHYIGGFDEIKVDL